MKVRMTMIVSFKKMPRCVKFVWCKCCRMISCLCGAAALASWIVEREGRGGRGSEPEVSHTIWTCLSLSEILRAFCYRGGGEGQWKEKMQLVTNLHWDYKRGYKRSNHQISFI